MKAAPTLVGVAFLTRKVVAVKILMVSGFLGAGKTTFIKKMAEITGRDFVVLENEYGQTDIDKQQLEQELDLEVFELARGCVCCTMKQDFATSILTISSALDPEVLIVEPTGVARLTSLLANVGQIEYERIRLLAPVVIIDGLLFERQLAEADEIYLDQLKTAPTVIVSKMEHADPDLLKAIEERIRELNPTAEIVTDPYAERSPEWFLSLLNHFADGQVEEPEDAEDADLETFTIRGAELDSPTKLIAILDAMSFGAFGRVLRAKGYLPCNGAWLRFDVVDGLWGITGFWNEDDPEDENFEANFVEPEESEIVVIGRNLQRSFLRELLLPLYRRNQIGDSNDGGEAPAHGDEGHVCGPDCGHEHDHDHEHGESCGCGHDHDHEHGESCGCGHGDGHNHKHDAHNHNHEHGEDCTCGCHEHKH